MSVESALKAAETRRLRAGKSRAPESMRGAGVSPQLVISHVPETPDDYAHLEVAIAFVRMTDEELENLPRHLLNEDDRALSSIFLRASADDRGDEPALVGFDRVRVKLESPDLAAIDRVTPFMRRLDRFLEMVREESEDTSFAKAIDSLAAHLRVARIVWWDENVSEQHAKRGSAYKTALRIEQNFLREVLEGATRPDEDETPAAAQLEDVA